MESWTEDELVLEESGQWPVYGIERSYLGYGVTRCTVFYRSAYSNRGASANMARFWIGEAQSSSSSSVKHRRGQAQPRDLHSVNRREATGSRKKHIASPRKYSSCTCKHIKSDPVFRVTMNPPRSSNAHILARTHYAHKPPYCQSVHPLEEGWFLRQPFIPRWASYFAFGDLAPNLWPVLLLPFITDS